jgi:hypothetical protein
MRRWQKKNRKKVRAYNAAWKAANPEKVKAHKKKAASKYAIRRRMLYKTRSPERIAEDNRKALEAYHRRYPNRSPEQVEKDKKKSRDKYQNFLDAKQQAERIIAQGKLAMPHRRADDERGARLDQLSKQGLKWKVIHPQIEREFNTHTTLDALRMLLKRFRERTKAA